MKMVLVHTPAIENCTHLYTCHIHADLRYPFTASVRKTSVKWVPEEMILRLAPRVNLWN